MLLIIIRILVAVYYISASVYGFMIVNSHKKSDENDDKCNRVTDGKIFFASMLGGAVGVYIAMFVFKHKLKSVTFMVLTPVIAAAHICLLFFGYTQNFSFINY